MDPIPTSQEEPLTAPDSVSQAERVPPAQNASPLDLLVIGGGPSGLAYALGAARAAAVTGRSLRYGVLEAAPRPGGWVHTRHAGPYALETGPYGYLDKHPELGRIQEILEIGDDRREPAEAARNRYVLARGKLRRMPRGPLSFLFSRILTLRGKLRLLREPWAPARPAGEDESVAAFATRRLGRQAAEALVVPMFNGIYAGDPERASLAACFPRMAELERDYGGLFRALWHLRKKVKRSGQGVGAPRGVLTSFRGGLSTLVEALQGYHGDHLQLNCPARAIQRNEKGYDVVTDAGRLPARRVVLAVPAPAAAALLGPLDPRLAEPLQAIPYAGVSVVHTAYEAQAAARVPPGFGYLTPRTARRAVLGAVFVSTIFPEHAPAGQVLLRNVLGGALRPELLELEDEELLRRVRGEHRDLLGVRAPPEFTDVERYPAALPQYRLGHLAGVEALERALEAWPGLWVTGNALRGIGLADCLAKNFARGLDDLAGGREGRAP